MHFIILSLNSHLKPQPAKRETARRKSYESDSKMLISRPRQLVNRKRPIWFPQSSFCYHAVIEIIQ